jgi:uncharacterized protein (DUF305 family)
MENKILLTAVLALLIGTGIGYVFGKGATPSSEVAVEDVSHGTMHGAMSDMTASLEGKTGEDFDKAFLTEMIVHHEGAVAMAQLALVNAKHAEIKTMATAIISAQTTEIEQMKNWQTAWYQSE